MVERSQSPYLSELLTVFWLLCGAIGIVLIGRVHPKPVVIEEPPALPVVVEMPAPVKEVIPPPQAPLVVPEGVLEITLSHDAEVYMGNKFLAEVMGEQAFKVKLPVGYAQSFHFVNKKLRIDSYSEYSTREDGVVRAYVELESVLEKP